MSIPGTPPENEPENQGMGPCWPRYESDVPFETGSPARGDEVTERTDQPAPPANPYWQPGAGPAHGGTGPAYGPPAGPAYGPPAGGSWVPYGAGRPGDTGPGAGGQGPGGPWGGSYGHGPQPPYFGHDEAAPTPPKRHRLRNGLLLAALLVGAAGGGVAAGHETAARTPSASSSSSGGSSSASGGSSSGGSGLSPFSPGFGGFGSGGSGGSGGSIGTGGSSGSASSGSSTGVGAGGSSINASALAAKVDPAVVDVNVVLGYEDASAAGTGIVLTSNGEILTNNHVVDGATSIRVTDIGNGRTYTAKVVGTDATQDIAVIQLEGASGLATANLGNSSTLKSGEPVLAIGNAGGVGGTPSTAAGAVVNLDQAITATDSTGADSEHLTGLVETDAPIQAGDSGGPLVDKAGQVLAIDTAASSGSQFQSSSDQAYAIPIDTALSIASQIENGQSSSVIHIGTAGMLGIEVESTATAGSSGSGAVIVSVLPGSPAASAGLASGDAIVSINGQAVSSPSALSSLMGSHHPGDRVAVGYDDSAGQLHTVTVTLAAGPPS